MNSDDDLDVNFETFFANSDLDDLFGGAFDDLIYEVNLRFIINTPIYLFLISN